MGKLSKLKKVQDLFVTGVELEVPEAGLTFWVQALSSFERQQTHEDARVAMLLAMSRWDSSEEEQQHLELFLKNTGNAGVARTIALAERDEIQNKVVNDLLSEEKLQDKAELWTNFREEDATAEEREQYNELDAWFKAERDLRTNALIHEREAEVAGWTRGELESEIRSKLRNARGEEAYAVRRLEAEILYSLRNCDAVVSVVDEERTFDHSQCDHTELFLAEGGMQAVRDLPDAMKALVVDAIASLKVSEAQAGK